MKHPKHLDTDEATARRMANVKLKKGYAETLLAKGLWREGFRYRLNYKKLPGSPDIAILRHKIAVFIDGEFWHGYDWERKKGSLKRNKEYWVEKIEENISRDDRADKALILMGWTPIHFWTKDILKNEADCIKAVKELTFDLQLREYE